MALQFIQTLRFSFRLAVTDADERDDRGYIHHGKCIRILRHNFSGCDQRTENTGVLAQDALLCISCHDLTP